jgi:hypothetical protein
MPSRIPRAALCLICVAGLVGPRAKLARADGRATDTYLDQTRERWERVVRQIWDTPETGLKETRSSAALGEYWIRDATGESVNEMMERLKQ